MKNRFTHGDVRKGLTLGELLVILLLVGIVVAALVPWMLRSRERQRTQTCALRQMQVAQAILRREQALGHFPGYANRLGKPPDAAAASWVVEVLGELGHRDLAEAWNAGKRPLRYLPGLVCPDAIRSAPEPGDARLSYVVNCGRADRPNDPACGVFFDLRVERPVFLSRKDVDDHDGSETTLMLSENLQAGPWSDLEVADLGMLWWREPAACSRINRCREAPPGAHPSQYARPSSWHPGGVNAAWCDAHVDFLGEGIDYRVLQQLMAPDDQAAGLNANP